MIRFVDLWVYLSGTPLLWFTVTLIAYIIADYISAACNRNPLANPVLIAIVFVSSLLLLSKPTFQA